LFRHMRIANASQHIGNGVSYTHLYRSPNTANGLPARFDYTRDFPLISQLTETNAAQTKSSQIASRAATSAAAVMLPHVKLAFLFPLNHRFFGHS